MICAAAYVFLAYGLVNCPAVHQAICQEYIGEAPQALRSLAKEFANGIKSRLTRTQYFGIYNIWWPLSARVREDIVSRHGGHKRARL